MARSLGGLGDLFGSSSNIDWQGDPEDLLYEGERIEERVGFGAGELVVTSHRLLVFAPDSSGSQFETIDRPNVVGLDIGHDGDAGLLGRALKWAFGGVALVVASQFVDLNGLVGDVDFGSAAGIGMGGLFGMLQTMLNLITRIDELMRIFGALAVILAMVMLAAYMLTRDRVLTVALAGREDAVVAVPEGVDDDTVEAVRAALSGGSAGGGRGGATEAPTGRRGRDHDARGHLSDGRPPEGDGRRESSPHDDGSFKSDDRLGPPDESGGGP